MSTPTNGHDPSKEPNGPNDSNAPAASSSGSQQSNSDLPQYNPPAYQQPSYQQPAYQQPSGPQGNQQAPGSQQGYGQAYGGANQTGGYQPQGGPKKIKGTPPLWLGITLTIAGPVIGILALIISLVALAGTVSEMTDAQSGSSQTLEANTDYWILAGDGSTSVSSCSVYGPDSSAIDVNVSPNSEASAQSGSTEVTMVATFTSEEAGDYSVYCDGILSSDIYVAEANLGGILGGTFGLIGGILIGGLIFLIGITLIIINRVTASRRRREAGVA